MHTLKKYFKEDFIKDLLHINWVSTLEPMSDSSSEMASTFYEVF